SIFPSSSSKKTPARSPLSTVTTAVTSTAAIENTASPQLTTTTIATNTSAPPSPAASSNLHGESGSSPTAATPKVADAESTSEHVQEPAGDASSDRPQEASPDLSGHIEGTYPQSLSSLQDEAQADRAANLITMRPPPPPAEKTVSPPSTPTTSPTSRESINISSSDTASTSFAYPSITISATGNNTTPVALNTPQEMAVSPSDARTTATTSTAPAGASGNSKTTTSRTAAASTGKTVTPYMLCRQDFERAHPGVDKKSMTALFKAHWKQLGKNEREEWQKRARLANESHVQVRITASSVAVLSHCFS
ncbi:hypothetical protein GGF50DRAFT_56866, partial [Schizophyllum commune]